MSNTFFPPTPKTVGKVHRVLSELNIKTDKGDSFLFINNDRENIVVFSCETSICLLNSVSRIYLDGTFDYCIQHFYQFFIIHDFKKGHYIPLLFCLLLDKRAETYKKACKVTLRIYEIVMGFNKAIKAVEESWQNIRIIGCRFPCPSMLPKNSEM